MKYDYNTENSEHMSTVTATRMEPTVIGKYGKY